MNVGEQLAWFTNRYGPAAGERGPELFVREQLHAIPDPFQLAVLRAYGRGARHIAIESCHGPGKTCVIAWLVLVQMYTWYPQKVAATAPTAGQMDDALLPEVKSWLGRLPPPLQAVFEVKADRIIHRARPNDSFASFQTARPEQPEALQGKHSRGKVLLIADEADGVAGQIFEAALGSMSGHNACTVLAGNPVRTAGFFYSANHGEGSVWFRVHVAAVDGPHCEPVRPDGSGSYVSGRVDAQFVDLIRTEYGEESNQWRVRVLGRPPKSEAEVIIPFEVIEAAREREVQRSVTAPIYWGVDVARSGFDLSALAKRQGQVLLEPVKTWGDVNDAMILAGHIVHEYRAAETQPGERPEEILIDEIGLGGPLVDRLRELGLPVRGVNVSELPAMDGSRYRDLGTELWYAARDWFFSRTSSIPKDPRLEEELAAQKYKIINSSGKTMRLPKDEMKKYLHPRRSPDRADAFVLTFASHAATAAGAPSTSWNQPLKRRVGNIT